MMKRWLQILLVLQALCMCGSPYGDWLSVSESHAATTSIGEKVFGGSADDYGYSIKNTSDGGYIIAGTTASSGAGNSDVYLIKIDASGNKQWEKTFGGSSYDGAGDVIQAQNGDFVITGSTSSFGSARGRAYLLRTDSTGTKIWEKTYGGPDATGTNQLLQTSDGGFVLFGNSTDQDAWLDYYFIKVDASGNLQWTKYYNRLDDQGRGIAATNDGGFILVGDSGYWEDSQSRDQAWIVKVDSSGNKIWDTAWGGSNNDSASGVVVASDGSIYVVGSTSSYGAGGIDAFLLKLSSSGQVQWYKTFGGANTDYFTKIILRPNGNLVATGSTEISSGQARTWLVETDLNGNVINNQTFGSTGASYGNSLTCSDTGCAIAGYTNAKGAGGNDVYVVLTNVTLINGACGTADSTTVTAAPTTNLCTTGTASSVTGSGPWSWTCSGSGGGTTATCGANQLSTNSSIVFQDDFNDNSIDTAKWIVTRGNARVAEETGIMKVEQNVTDAGGFLESQWFTISPSAPLTITRKVKVHYANNYYYGNMQLLLENYANSENNLSNGFYGLSYYNDSYYPLVGMMLNTNIAGAFKRSPSLGSVLWDTWFEEKTVYNPQTGIIELFINGIKQGELNAGVLPKLPSYRIKLQFSPYGWFTGHYQYMDDLVISQPSGGDTAAPQISSFTIPTSLTIQQGQTSTSISISTFTATDNVGVTGYLVNESSTPPSASSASWQSSVPSSYGIAMPQAGTKTLYAWVKDVAGNVSAASTATFTITLNTFTLTATKTGSGAGTITPSTGTLTPTTTGSLTSTGNFTSGSQLNLTATPDTGSTFMSWTGCDSTTATTCTITMSAAKNVTVVFKDTAAPTVATLTATPTPNSLFPAVTLSATDNVKVTGYYLSETNDDPVAGSSGWNTNAPTYFAFTSFGTKTLYAWAKDAAGNVSPLKTASVTLVDLPPTVTSSTPANGLTSVALNSTISVAFSEFIDSTSINPAKFLKVGNTYIPGNVSFLNRTAAKVVSAAVTSTDGFSFTPSAPLSYGTTYTYTIDSVKDLTGNLIASPYSASFTTVAKPENVIIPSLSLALSASSTLTDNTGPLTVSGAMTAGTLNIAGQPITATITKPDGSTVIIPLVTDNNGAFSTDLRSNLTSGGRYSVQASAGSSSRSTDVLVTTIAPATSSALVLRVLDQTGTAIIVTGSIPNGEGKDSHLKTATRVKNALIARGFAESDIISITSVSGNSGKTALTAALASAKIAITAKPSSLHLILIDHGDNQQFHMDSDVLVPTELAAMLDTFEANLSPQALDQPRYITIGSCYSGSFIDSIKKNGRTIITSAKNTEQSFRGPMEPDTIRSGEYFLDEYYGALKKGKSIRDAFNTATANTATYTRRGGIVSSFGDKPLQNPLISVGGLSGTTWLPTGFDDNAPDTLYLGAGADAAYNPTSLIRTDRTASIDAIFLDDKSLGATISINAPAGQTAWFEYRAPSNKLATNGSSSQLVVNLPKVDMTWNSATQTYSGIYNNFYEQGSYDITIYLQDSSGDITRKHLTLYRNRSGNLLPSAAALITPADADTVQSTFVPIWNMATDPDGDMVTYTLVVSKNQDMSNPVHVQEGLADPYAIISYDDGLLDLTTYYWQVLSIDSYGGKTASAVKSFKTDYKNGLPGLIKGYVRDTDGTPVAGAVVKIGNLTFITPNNGVYLFITEPSSYSLTATAKGYTGKTTNLVATAGQIVSNDIALNAIVPTVWTINTQNQGLGQGYVDCPATVKDSTQIICSIQPAANYKLFSIEGCGGTLNGNQYSFTAAANCTIKPTFNAVILYGDCDGSKNVAITEVQNAINMFLGVNPVKSCVDIDNSGAVSISEVQKVVNSFLGL